MQYRPGTQNERDPGSFQLPYREEILQPLLSTTTQTSGGQFRTRTPAAQLWPHNAVTAALAIQANSGAACGCTVTETETERIKHRGFPTKSKHPAPLCDPVTLEKKMV